MRLTESKLRRIIRSVIKENLDSLGSAETISGTIDCETGRGDLFQNVCRFIKNKLNTVLDADTVKFAFDKSDLAEICMLDYNRGRGEDALLDNEEIMCQFSVESYKNRYDFINVDDNCKSFSVSAEIQDQDSFDYNYGDVVLYLEEYQG